MSRLAAKVRCNYFPLPDAEANLIRSCLAFPDQETSALDPRSGEGRAMAAMTAASEATTYGIVTGPIELPFGCITLPQPSCKSNVFWPDRSDNRSKS